MKRVWKERFVLFNGSIWFARLGIAVWIASFFSPDALLGVYVGILIGLAFLFLGIGMLQSIVFRSIMKERLKRAL